MSFSISGVFAGGGGGRYMKGGGEGDLLMSLSLDSYLIIFGSYENDMIFLERVAAWFVGVLWGGSRRVSEGEGEGVFLRKLSKDLSFCVAVSLEEMGFKVVGDGNGCAAGS